MKITILGAGQVGGNLAESLTLEDNDIVVVDHDLIRLHEIREKLDVGTIHGHAAHPDTLKKAECDDADMLIAVTNSDETNMIACQVAHSIFEIPMKIARIRSDHYQHHKELFAANAVPIDVLIRPEKIIANYMNNILNLPGALQVINFDEHDVQIVSTKACANGKMTGEKIKKLFAIYPDLNARFIFINRHRKVITPTLDDYIQVGDEITFIANKEDVITIMEQFVSHKKQSKNIMIAGGGYTGFCLAKELENNFSVKIIEHNAKRAQYIAENLDHSLVLLGSTADKELLINEDIDNIDLFCAFTNNDGVNIMSTLLAKRLGAKQVVSLITSGSYSELIAGSEIDIAISPQQLTIGAVLRHARTGDIVNVHRLKDGINEVMEIIVHGDKNNSKVIGCYVANLPLDKEAKVIAIMRKNKIIINDVNETIIESDDHLLIYVPNSKLIANISKVFQVNVNYI